MPTEPRSHNSRRARKRIVGKIRVVLKNLSGQDQSAAASDVSFLELGFDSLLLTQVAQAFRKEFGVKVTFRQLLEDYSTMETLAGYLDSQLPPEAPAPVARANFRRCQRCCRPAGAGASGSKPSDGGAAESKRVGVNALERVIQEQLKVMAHQLEMLRGHGGAERRAGNDSLTPAPCTPLPGATDFSTPDAYAAQGGTQGIRPISPD